MVDLRNTSKLTLGKMKSKHGNHYAAGITESAKTAYFNIMFRKREIIYIM